MSPPRITAMTFDLFSSNAMAASTSTWTIKNEELDPYIRTAPVIAVNLCVAHESKSRDKVVFLKLARLRITALDLVLLSPGRAIPF